MSDFLTPPLPTVAMTPLSALDHDFTCSSSSPAIAGEPLAAKLRLFSPFHRPCRRSCLMPGLRAVFPHYRRKDTPLSSLSRGEPLFWAAFGSSSQLLVVRCHGQHHLAIGRHAPPSGCRASLPFGMAALFYTAGVATPSRHPLPPPASFRPRLASCQPAASSHN
jgi:hypothetical protein